MRECAAIWHELNIFRIPVLFVWRFRSSFILRAGLGPRLRGECISLISRIDRIEPLKLKLVCITPYQLGATDIVYQGAERIEHCLVSVICQQLGG